MNRYIYLFIVLCIALASFYFYAPFNHWDFNSDHAVHALMANDFDWQHGAYYWGQNRLGSFLPWIASFPVKWFSLHPLYVTGTLNYIFLFCGFLIVAKHLKSLWQRVIFACFVFWPLFAFHYLLLIGHPYGAQFFLLALAWVALRKTGGWLLAGGYEKTLLHFTLCMLCIAMACWVSELSAVIVLLFLLLTITNGEIRKEAAWLWKKKKPLFMVLVVYALLCAYAAYYFYSWTKSMAPPHEEYNRIFISGDAEITKQWRNFIEDLTFRLTHTDGDWRWTGFYYSLILASVALFVTWVAKQFRKEKSKNVLWIYAVTLLSGCVILFFSTWNFVSAFEMKYFTPLYVLFVFYLLYAAQKTARLTHVIVLMLCSISSVCALLDNKRILSGNDFNPRTELSPFSQLPEGGLIGGYWLCYKVSAFAPDNLTVVPIQQDYVRNYHMVTEVFSKPRIYVIKNGYLPDSLPMPDTLIEHRRVLVKTGNDTTISAITIAPYKVHQLLKREYSRFR